MEGNNSRLVHKLIWLVNKPHADNLCFIISAIKLNIMSLFVYYVIVSGVMNPQVVVVMSLIN